MSEGVGRRLFTMFFCGPNLETGTHRVLPPLRTPALKKRSFRALRAWPGAAPRSPTEKRRAWLRLAVPRRAFADLCDGAERGAAGSRGLVGRRGLRRRALLVPGLGKAAALKARVRNAVRWLNEGAGENGRGGKAASAEGALTTRLKSGGHPHPTRTPWGREPPPKCRSRHYFVVSRPVWAWGPGTMWRCQE